MVNEGMFSSKHDDWETPQNLYDYLNAEFDFDLDPCASHSNRKCANFYTKGDNGLSRRWYGNVFVNPPYGRVIGRWVEKAYQEAQCGATVVMLIPARTDTRYWHDFVMKAAEVRLCRGRLHFSGGGRAPFPSAVVVFKPGKHAARFTSLVV